jgi:cytosine/uracil/thiamine/allantoin permease
VHAYVVASRFGMLLGLALWLGLAAALLLAFPVFEKQLPSPQARELSAALCVRLEKVLFLAMALVLLGLGARLAVDQAAPPVSLVAPVAAMTLSRLLSALAVSPTLGALLKRLGDASASASDDERSAVSRLSGARGLLLSLEVCLCLYAFLAVS